MSCDFGCGESRVLAGRLETWTVRQCISEADGIAVHANRYSLKSKGSRPRREIIAVRGRRLDSTFAQVVMFLFGHPLFGCFICHDVAGFSDGTEIGSQGDCNWSSPEKRDKFCSNFHLQKSLSQGPRGNPPVPTQSRATIYHLCDLCKVLSSIDSQEPRHRTLPPYTAISTAGQDFQDPKAPCFHAATSPPILNHILGVCIGRLSRLVNCLFWQIGRQRSVPERV
jgi:hypothetical protein